MENIEKTISNFIESQFPAYYRENGPVLIAFVTEYYKWLESEGQAVYHSRRLLDYKDIDNTVNQFLIYFKNKYLSDIQFDTVSDIRQLVKHTLDLYRSKGTERSIDLLFRVVFGVGAEVYYPSVDIFKPSDGKWKKPRYLEVALSEDNILFAEKEIKGLTSGAIAFVEKVVRKTVADRLIDVLYISAIKGEFSTEEALVLADGSNTNLRAKMIGSLSDIILDLNGVGTNYNIGSIVELSSQKGRQGKGRVTGVTDIAGVVNFKLENGGYGYDGNAEVIVSEKVISLSNVQINANNITNNYFKYFESLVQPYANIVYTDLSGNTYFPEGTLVYTYHPNNAVKGSGIVLAQTNTSITAGQVRVSVYSGNLQDTKIYSTANTISANQATYTNKTATANIMGISSNLTIAVTNCVNRFIRTEEVYQLNSNNDTEIANGTVVTYLNDVGSNGTVLLSNVHGIFKNNLLIRNRANTKTGNAQRIDLNIGVYDISNAFIITNGNYVYSSNTLSNATIKALGQGTGATFAVSNDVIYTEEILDLNTDYLRDYLTVNLNAAQYNFPNEPTANGDPSDATTIGEALTIVDLYIGKIRALTSINRGSDYNIPPFVLIYQPEIYNLRIKDNIVNISNLTGNFTPGELVTQKSTGARGIIKPYSNSSVLYLERLNIYDVDYLIPETTEVTVNTSANNTTLIKLSTGNTSQLRTGYYVTYSDNSSVISLAVNAEILTIVNSSSFIVDYDITVANGTSNIVITRPVTSNNFEITVDANSQIKGFDSGFIANVTLVSEDANSEYLGLNAIIFANTVTANGSITSMEIVDSGFGYFDGEELTFENQFGISSGFAVVEKSGRGQGFYQKKGGLLSDTKKLFDGYYYQEYSYDVQSSLTLDKYSDMLKKILHVAGTKYFGSFIYNTKANSQTNVTSFSISYSSPELFTTETGNWLITENSNTILTES